jgi:hypothetical protein
MMYILCTGKTEQEAREKAEKMIKEMDYMQQPHLGAVYQHLSGEWKATIQYWGLD